MLNKDYWYQIQEIAKIAKPYNFEFKESKKIISLNIDNKILEDSKNLYNSLIELPLKKYNL